MQTNSIAVSQQVQCESVNNIQDKEWQSKAIAACAGMADPAAEIEALKQVGIANAQMHLEAVDSAAEIAAMREAIKKAYISIQFAEASFAGLALRLHPSDPSNDAILKRTSQALAHLRPFLPCPPAEPAA